MIEPVDERAQSGIERWVTSVFESGAFTDSEYLRGLVRVLRTIAAHGGAVVVGRGAQFALDPAATLRLRVVAPKAVRVTRIAHRDRLAEEDARAQVLAMDERWREYVHHHFQADIDDPVHYDVVINTGRYGIPASMDLVLAAFRARFRDLETLHERCGSRARPWPDDSARAVSPLEHRINLVGSFSDAANHR